MAKEPWEMTLAEFKGIVPAPHKVRDGVWRVAMDTRPEPRSSRVRSETSRAYPDEQAAKERAPRDFHWYVLFDAILAGKPVSLEILAAYPDLVVEYEKAKQRAEAKARVQPVGEPVPSDKPMTTKEAAFLTAHEVGLENMALHGDALRVMPGSRIQKQIQARIAENDKMRRKARLSRS